MEIESALDQLVMQNQSIMSTDRQKFSE